MKSKEVKNFLASTLLGNILTIAAILLAILFFILDRGLIKFRPMSDLVSKLVNTTVPMRTIIYLALAYLFLIFIIEKIKARKLDINKRTKFVTSHGVWWKIDFATGYIEDFPYCPCCEPKQKLVQIQGLPEQSEEKYMCPKTRTELQLFGILPERRIDILDALYDGYFGYKWASRFREKALAKFKREKELHPEKDDIDILKKVFKEKPLKRIPKKIRTNILSKHSNPNEAFTYIAQNFDQLKHYIFKWRRR